MLAFLSKRFQTTSPNYRMMYEKLRNCTSSSELNHLLSTSKDFNAFNCATALGSLARLNPTNHHLLNRILEISNPLHFPPRDLCECLRTIAKHHLASAIPEILSSKLQDADFSLFNTQDLANFIYPFARLKQKDISPVLLKLANELKSKSRNLQTFKPQELSIIIWSLATLKSPHALPVLFHEFSRRNLRDFSAQSISNIMYALGCLVVPLPEGVLSHIERELLRRGGVSEFNAQDISNCLWALAQCNAQVGDMEKNCVISLCNLFYKDLVHKRNLDTFTTRNMSVIMHAFCSLKYNRPALGDVVFLSLEKRNFGEFSPQDLSNLLWAFACLPSSLLCPRVALELEVRPSLSNFTPQALSNIVWAFAKCRFIPENRVVMQRLCQEITEKRLLLPQTFSNFLYACAQLNYRDERMIDFLVEQQLSHQFDHPVKLQDVLNTLWSLACLDVLHSDVVRPYFQTLPLFEDNENHSSLVAIQLFQIRLAWQQVNPLIESRVLNSFPVLPIDLFISSSQFHEYVFALLQPYFSLGDLLKEHLVSGLLVDLFVPSKNVGIEVDGPKHFFQDGQTPTGKTLFKQRLLQRAGVKVYSINVHQWQRMDSMDVLEEVKKLARMIHNHQVI